MKVVEQCRQEISGKTKMQEGKCSMIGGREVFILAGGNGGCQWRLISP
jgi:hypothetical protein